MDVKNEMGVIVFFAQEAQTVGYEILSIRTGFPDATILHDGQEWLTEFEYQSSSFFMHGHDERGCDLVVCWKHDTDRLTVPVLELSRPDWSQGKIVRVSSEAKEVSYLRRVVELQKKEIDDLKLALETQKLTKDKSDSAIVSRREQVKKMHALAIANDQIAATLGVSTKTIERDLSFLQNGHLQKG